MRKLFSCLFCGAALVWMTCFCGDLLRFINNEVPMFSVEWRAAENYRHLGFGYKIGIYREPDGLCCFRRPLGTSGRRDATR